MNTRPNEYARLREACLLQLRRCLPRRRAPGTPRPAPPEAAYDWKVTLRGTPPVRLLVEQKNVARIARAQIHHLIARTARRTKKQAGHLTLWAPWIPDEMGALLREAGIFYADAVGNIHLDLAEQGLLVDVRGRTPERRPQAERGRLLEPTGLKVLHQLLAHAPAVNAPYREIAHGAGVALGTVAVVMRELQQAGYLVQTRKDFRELQRKPELLELFVRGYALKLRPACFLATYRHELKDPRRLHERLRKVLKPAGAGMTLTGGLAAEEATGYLSADSVTLFVDERTRSLLERERMLPDPDGGNLTLLEHFGPGAQDPADPAGRKATPLLIYAELLNNGRPRELEAARMIFDKHLKEAGREP